MGELILDCRFSIGDRNIAHSGSWWPGKSAAHRPVSRTLINTGLQAGGLAASGHQPFLTASPLPNDATPNNATKKPSKTADETAWISHGLMPGGNDTFSHFSSGKFEIDIRRRCCHESTRVQ